MRRFSFATTDGEKEEEVALEPEQAMSHSELFTPSFFTNEHPDTREDGEEILEAAQEDSTVVFLQKARTALPPALDGDINWYAFCIVIHAEFRKKGIWDQWSGVEMVILLSRWGYGVFGYKG